MLLVIAFCVYHAIRSKTRKLTYSHLKLTFRKVQTKRCIKLSITEPNTLTAPPPIRAHQRKIRSRQSTDRQHHDRPQRSSFQVIFQYLCRKTWLPGSKRRNYHPPQSMGTYRTRSGPYCTVHKYWKSGCS